MKSWEVEELARKSGMQEGLMEGRQAGLMEGCNKVNRLNVILSEAGRTEDIIKAANDAKYQEQLFQEFDL